MVALTGTFHDDAVSPKSTFFLLSAFGPFAVQNACIGPIAFAGWKYQNASRLEVMILPPVRPQLAKETAFSSRSRTPSFFVRCRVTFGGAHFLQLLLTLCTLPYGAQLWNLDRSQGGDADQCANANHDQFSARPANARRCADSDNPISFSAIDRCPRVERRQSHSTRRRHWSRA